MRRSKLKLVGWTGAAILATPAFFVVAVVKFVADVVYEACGRLADALGKRIDAHA